jgi:hypothetical protein
VTSVRLRSGGPALVADPSFVLEIVGAGRAIRLRPVGCIDLPGARSLLEALEAARGGWNAALVAIDLDGVTGVTGEAEALLVANHVPLDGRLNAA